MSPSSSQRSLARSVWLVVFLTPTVSLLLLVLIAQSQVGSPAAGVVVFLFCLIPVVALLVCGTTVWHSSMSLRWRLTGLVLTVLGMLLQCGFWLFIIVSLIAAAIAPA